MCSLTNPQRPLLPAANQAVKLKAKGSNGPKVVGRKGADYGELAWIRPLKKVFRTPLQMNDSRAAVQIRGDEEGADIGEDGFLRRARNEQIKSFHRPVLL